jgi:hypothetical protein
MVAEPDDDPTPPGRLVDLFDMEIVEFVLSWVPYGGPPTDECVPLFGMARHRLLARFREIVETGERRHLSTAELSTLERAATLHDATTVTVNDPSVGRRVLRHGVWRWT